MSRKLQGHGAERAAVTLQGLLDEASDIQVKALAKGHYAAAVAALTVLITRYAVSIVAVTVGRLRWRRRMAKRTNNSNEQKKNNPRSSKEGRGRGPFGNVSIFSTRRF